MNMNTNNAHCVNVYDRDNAFLRGPYSVDPSIPSLNMTGSPLLSSFAIAFMRLRLQIVEKAVWERKYCSLYAELCHRFAHQVDIDAGDAQQPQSQQPRAADDDEDARPENAAHNTYLAVLSVRAFLSPHVLSVEHSHLRSIDLR